MLSGGQQNMVSIPSTIRSNSELVTLSSIAEAMAGNFLDATVDGYRRQGRYSVEGLIA